MTGRIRTGSYTNKDGQKVYTTDVIVDEQEFAEKKQFPGDGSTLPEPAGFMNIPDGIEDEGLPFS